MKVIIRQKVGYRSRAGEQYPVGTEAEFDERLAVKLINYGIALPAPEPEPKPKPKPVVETAEKAPPENTAKRIDKPKARSSRSPARKG